MKKNIYTAEQIEEIQLNIIALLYYIKRQNKSNLPRCFGFIKRIIKNIDVCRENKYEDIDELSILIREDWKSAMEIHTGLPEYYISNENFGIQKAMNTAIFKQIKDVSKLIEV